MFPVFLISSAIYSQWTEKMTEREVLIQFSYEQAQEFQNLTEFPELVKEIIKDIKIKSYVPFSTNEIVYHETDGNFYLRIMDIAENYPITLKLKSKYAGILGGKVTYWGQKTIKVILQLDCISYLQIDYINQKSRRIEEVSSQLLFNDEQFLRYFDSDRIYYLTHPAIVNRYSVQAISKHPLYGDTTLEFPLMSEEEMKFQLAGKSVDEPGERSNISHSIDLSPLKFSAFSERLFAEASPTYYVFFSDTAITQALDLPIFNFSPLILTQNSISSKGDELASLITLDERPYPFKSKIVEPAEMSYTVIERSKREIFVVPFEWTFTLLPLSLKHAVLLDLTHNSVDRKILYESLEDLNESLPDDIFYMLTNGFHTYTAADEDELESLKSKLSVLLEKTGSITAITKDFSRKYHDSDIYDVNVNTIYHLVLSEESLETANYNLEYFKQILAEAAINVDMLIIYTSSQMEKFDGLNSSNLRILTIKDKIPFLIE